MKQSHRFRAHADECLRLADITDDSQRRATLINMGECWHALAARAEIAEDGARLDAGK
jgi:hypothetical protein